MKNHTGDHYSSYRVEDSIYIWGYHTNRLRWLVSQAKDTGSNPVIPTSAVVKIFNNFCRCYFERML